MSLNTIKPDMVRYEMRMVQGVDPNVREQKRPGAFGRFLSGMGKILGAVAMPLSFIFPPAAIAAAGMYGVGSIGDGMQNRAVAKTQEKAQRDAQPASFPGIELDGSQLEPAAFDLSNRDQQVMKVLDARGGATNQMMQLL